MESLAEGVQRYAQRWYRLDQLYRKYVYHVVECGQVTPMQKLSDMMESRYTNSFLLPLNNQWQRLVDETDKWQAAPVMRQDQFFTHYVEPFLKKEKKVFVVVSDALRFEAGQELQSLIRQEDRYEAELKPCLSMLPSYTQLGMAALLPGQALAISENGAGSTTTSPSPMKVLNMMRMASSVPFVARMLALSTPQWRAKKTYASLYSG